MLQLRKQRRERGIYSLVYAESQYSSRQGTYTVHVGHRHPLEQQRVPHPGLSRTWILEAQAEKRMQQAPALQGISLQKRVRERERIDTREPGFHGTGPSLYFSGKLLYCGLYLEINVRNSHVGSAALTLIETRLSLCIPICIHRSQVIYIIFWPGGLLAFYGPFLIRVRQPENLFALKVLFFPKSGATLRKH